ncbi:acyl-CoA dehydrogenase [Bordetella pertussis]|nr:acyl-CoA dehydrogenase [Bordetella pertussis]SUV85034.1 acyl-CoA dehydrogenase [Bordetella pertussis]
MGRKTLRDGGATAHASIAAMRDTLKAVAAEAQRADTADHTALRVLRDNFDQAIQSYEGAVEFILAHAASNVRAVYSSSVPYLMLAGVVHGGWQMARAALACRRHLAAGSGDAFHRHKLGTALFYGAHILPRALALAAAVRAGDVADSCGSMADIA